MELKRTVLIEAPVDKVWEAMTTPAGLGNWLGEEVSLDLKPRGALRVKSRIPLLSGHHAVEMIEPRQALGLSWRLEDTATDVLWRLKTAEGGTLVTVTHAVSEALRQRAKLDDSCAGELGFLDEVWAYGLLLLKSYVETGKAQCRLAPNEDPTKVDWTLDVPASAREAFLALTDPDRIRRWNAYAGAHVRVEPKEGGRYSFGWESEEKGTDGPGEVVELKDGHRITYTWHGNPRTLVSWEVEPLSPAPEQRTRIRLQHSGFLKDPRVVMEYKLGWAHFLYCFAWSLQGKLPVTRWTERIRN